MLSFANDYSEGTHEAILKRLMDTNLEQLPSYGSDRYCISAKEKIRTECGCPDADVYFLVGGTQTNATVIDAMLKKYEGVIAASTGHVSLHEAGAIEASGHKVLELKGHDARLEPESLRKYISSFYADANHEHMVFPGMVYISHPSEYGTLYTLKELKEISDICRSYGIPLYLDGARLGYALMADGSDVTLKDIARYCDAFYIGGTKVGALMGEAVVFTKNNTPAHFTTLIKQHGALLAKGWLLGIQFDTLFTDGLYYKISRNALETAACLRSGLEEKGYAFAVKSTTNQIFITVPDEKLAELAPLVRYEYWERADNSRSVIRLATSWATTMESVKSLLEVL